MTITSELRIITGINHTYRSKWIYVRLKSAIKPILSSSNEPIPQSQKTRFGKSTEINMKPWIPNLVLALPLWEIKRPPLRYKSPMIGHHDDFSFGIANITGINHTNPSKWIYMSLQSAINSIRSSSNKPVPQLQPSIPSAYYISKTFISHWWW